MLPALLVNSSLSRKVADRLISPFNAITTFFFRRSVEKAFQLDEQPPDLTLNLHKPLTSNPPHITSAVDDVMYIVNKLIQQSLATSQRAVVANVVPTIARVLGSDFVGMIQRKMRDESYPKAAVQGALPPEHTIVTFLVLLNNLDIATDYTKRIVSTQVATKPPTANAEPPPSSTPSTDLFPFDHDSTFVATTLDALSTTFDAKTTELIADGIYVIFKNVTKPRLRPILADAFRDIDYLLTDPDLAHDPDPNPDHNLDPHTTTTTHPAAEDLVQRRFQAGWDALTRPLARLLTDRNFDRLLSSVVAYLAEVLEKRVWSYYGRVNELGAVRLERDVSGVVGAVVRGGRYALRDAFGRCVQVCMVMNMEEDEWEEVVRGVGEWGDGGGGGRDAGEGLEWRIDAEERARARGMVRRGR